MILGDSSPDGLVLAQHAGRVTLDDLIARVVGRTPDAPADQQPSCLVDPQIHGDVPAFVERSAVRHDARHDPGVERRGRGDRAEHRHH